ncbi:DUF2085 domain-containing protein [Methanobacterium sp.]|uniref:DUF2085 domain-containing protein n=1 Tax=Methanobacterium sp. TaxID=2164 RepID=UPI0025F3C250|nr:DUF2085 domain-containing protein [Methanobacterium sp.]MBI5460143.1 DUF2085 domain-containing protein [Methanobacterium sp.]
MTSNSSFFFQFICHCIPERTFNIKGYYFPVCSRCTGIYTGAILFFIYSLLFLVDYTLILIPAPIIILPLVIDGSTQFLGLRKSNNSLRFITGFTAGTGAAIIITFIKISIL